LVPRSGDARFACNPPALTELEREGGSAGVEEIGRPTEEARKEAGGENEEGEEREEVRVKVGVGVGREGIKKVRFVRTEEKYERW
jgi:hypothetical protein